MVSQHSAASECLKTASEGVCDVAGAVIRIELAPSEPAANATLCPMTLQPLVNLHTQCGTLLALLKLLMKTTSTAQYTAEAAKSSCLCALVRRDIAAEKRRVKTTRTPIALKVDCCAPIAVRLYIAMTGKTRSVKIMLVMIRPTSFSTRDLA